MVDKEKIYIRLLDEGVDSWLPTYGQKVFDNEYVVLPTKDYDPECEKWEFVPGTKVFCELQEKHTGRGKKKKVLVAVSRI